ncbi:hypothetical protein DH2020_024598 [Rehmannia glutinosa]|uniref:NAC domain-containing protein n=1 Tax=Rehmannia glutinosa TaxID=99300 RepID=A0ABR0W4R7_REHGL
MGLRDIGDSLPPGFRFYPSDEELVCHYLYKKIANEEVLRGTLVEIDLHVCEPWQLPDVAKLNSNEWYFFSFRDRKYATGFRTNRATTSGYWKATGKDKTVLNLATRAVVGMRKTLVFYKNRAPNGIKTGWIMHEFRLENPHVPPKVGLLIFLIYHSFNFIKALVFNKSRSGENNNKSISPNNLYDPPNLVSNSSPTNIISDHQHAMPCAHQSITSFYHSPNPSTSLGLCDEIMNEPRHILSSNYSYDQEKVVDQATKCEDDYGFLFDFDGSNGVPSSLEDHMGFDDDNGSVFI